MEEKSINSSMQNEKMPIFFIGHGSPMNAIEDTEFSRKWREIGNEIPKPSAVLCISAHWETRGTSVTAMKKPKTIHDFGGFPQSLFEVQYPAQGSPDLANRVHNIITKTDVTLVEKWGLDHGCWSILRHIYPDADVPVVQLSLNRIASPQEHYNLGKELSALRREGILIIGSGNMVHNLRYVAWHKLNDTEYGYDWAFSASNKMKEFIQNGAFSKLINYSSQGSDFNNAIPTPEHFLPLLYILALKEVDEQIEIFNDKIVGGSLSMTSLKIF